MPFEKVPYTDNETVIYAKNLNDIQDELIRLNTAKQNKITIDSEPTSGSTNPVASNGVYNAINAIDVEVSELEEAIVTDKTLAVPDKSADAAVTGDKIRTIDTTLTKTTGNAIIPVTEKNKYLRLQNGVVAINSPTVSSNFDYYLIPCSEGDTFTVSAVGGASARAWLFTKEDGTAIRPYAAENVSVNDLELTAPAGAAYLVINDKGSCTSYYGHLIKNRVHTLEQEVAVVGQCVDTDTLIEIQPGLSLVRNLFQNKAHGLVVQDDEIVESETTYIFTDYIPCSEYIAFEIKGTDTRIFCYFYTLENDTYTLTWDVLNYTTSGNTKNYFGQNAYNKVISVPDHENTYFRFAIAVGSAEDVNVYTWNGRHFGMDVSASWRHVELDNDVPTVSRSVVNVNLIGSYLPPTARLILCKDVLIRDVFGFKFVNGEPDGEQILSDVNYQAYTLPGGYDYYMVNFLI